jgi:hypothetical protein
MRTTLVFYLPIGLAVLATVLYHLTQRDPVEANASLALGVTYLAAMLLCLPCCFPPEGSLVAGNTQAELGQHRLHGDCLPGVALLACAVVGISACGDRGERGRALLLLPIGLLFFPEHLTPLNIAGVVVCIGGLVMISLK